MARFFALGPLNLILCLVLYSSTPTYTTDPPANTTEGETKKNTDSSTPTNTTDPPANATEGSITGNNETNTSILPAHTSQQQNTSTTADKIQTSSPADTSQQQNTITTAGTTEIPCQYSLIKNGDKEIAREVKINGSENQIYRIRIMDKNNNTLFENNGSNLKPFEILFKWLKPCTEYSISVDGCKPSGDVKFTSSDKNEIVSPDTVTDDKVCFQGKISGTQWNLTECIEITKNNSCKTEQKHIQFDTCTYTMNAFMPPVKPNINLNNEAIPSQFEWNNKPAQCNDSLKVICTNDNGKKPISYDVNVEVSLLPDILYSCTGEYPYENQPIKSNELSFEIKCDDWQKNGRFKHRSKDSFEISWNSLEEDKCSGITWDSYSVSCTIHDKSSKSYGGSCTKHKNGIGTDCSIKKLVPYKTYTCSIYAKVSSIEYVLFTSKDATLSTNPIFQSEIEVTHPSHNSLQITCENKGEKIVWNGGEGTFMAEITYNGETISKKNTTCLFTFSDLYYLTTYDIKITAENKEGHSAFLKHKADTKYNDKAVIGFLAFLIVVTAVVLPFVLFKIKRKRISHHRDGEDEDCVYVNVDMHLHRMETKQQTRG